MKASNVETVSAWQHGATTTGRYVTHATVRTMLCLADAYVVIYTTTTIDFLGGRVLFLKTAAHTGQKLVQTAANVE
jgi:hypothetical protein